MCSLAGPPALTEKVPLCLRQAGHVRREGRDDQALVGTWKKSGVGRRVGRRVGVRMKKVRTGPAEEEPSTCDMWEAAPENGQTGVNFGCRQKQIGFQSVQPWNRLLQLQTSRNLISCSVTCHTPAIWSLINSNIPPVVPPAPLGPNKRISILSILPQIPLRILEIV